MEQNEIDVAGQKIAEAAMFDRLERQQHEGLMEIKYMGLERLFDPLESLNLRQEPYVGERKKVKVDRTEIKRRRKQKHRAK